MSRATHSLRIALLMLSAATATNAVSAQPSAVVEQPRPFGYVIGDLVTQRVLLSVEPRELPPVQRVNIWFERRAPRIETASDGRRWLVVDYQVINAPPVLSTVQIPAWQLKRKEGSSPLAIPAAKISVAPLISETADAAGYLQPDREVSIIDSAPVRERIWLWSIALIVILAAWLGWLQWRNWQDSHNRPFARALREMRRIDERAPEAWQAVHRAFDRTAGRVLQLETLPVLFERAPHLTPRRADIETFFAQSNQRFFGAGSPHDLLSVRALCQDLRQIERQHAP